MTGVPTDEERRWERVGEDEDCEPVVMDVAAVRAELRAGRMTGSEQADLALDHAGLL